MTEPLNPDYCFECSKCGKLTEMIWGEDNQVCENCKGSRVVISKMTLETPPEEYPARLDRNYFYVGDDGTAHYMDEKGEVFPLEKLIRVQQFYANPENWRRFPDTTDEECRDPNLPPYFWIGDGGEFARKNLE